MGNPYTAIYMDFFNEKKKGKSGLRDDIAISVLSFDVSFSLS